MCVIMLLSVKQFLKGCWMTNKVYWKGLELVLNAAKRYIQKWDLQLQANLTTAQYNCVIATLDAILTCLGALPSNTPTE